MKPTSYPLSYQTVGHLDDSDFKLQSKSTDLALRLPRNEDVSVILNILQNKANSEHDKSISEATTEELEGIARRWTSLSQPLAYLNFLILHRDTPIGIAGLGWIGPTDGNEAGSDRSRAGAAGVILEPFARGKGHAYEALRVVFDYGLYELGLVEIRVGSHSRNVPMKMLMEQKFGLEVEGNDGHDSVDEFGNDLLWIIKDGYRV
ncbi:Acyl-CoA N-acyltransferase [Penicillium italicum]|uniref:Acyl-CoA N-acyltransferase n=1 Tax=Penicillium italicum TaxID=40296 RepID=A0A0A2KTS4_PENIT|nr:Acyl-CoA N-acyltransferase [Penicillium italicum]